MGMMVVHGAQAGGFSPISIYGVTVNNIASGAGLENSPLALFLGSLFFNAAIGVLLFTFLGGRDLIGRSVHDHDDVRPEDDTGAVGGGKSPATVMRGFGTTTTKARSQAVTAERRRRWPSRSRPSPSSRSSLSSASPRWPCSR